jgi:hypothetical protein
MISGAQSDPRIIRTAHLSAAGADRRRQASWTTRSLQAREEFRDPEKNSPLFEFLVRSILILALTRWRVKTPVCRKSVSYGLDSRPTRMDRFRDSLGQLAPP